jgi:hypothetical protein
MKIKVNVLHPGSVGLFPWKLKLAATAVFSLRIDIEHH